MTTATQKRSLLDTPIARLLAVLLAIVCIFTIWTNWRTDLVQVGMQVTGIETDGTQNTQTSVAPINPALNACLDQRVGDVENMQREGILSKAQYAKFKARAQSLCRAQNPA